MAPSKESLIRELMEEGYLKTTVIIEAFRAVDRKDFVLPEYGEEAYANQPLPIGLGQTISQPLTVAFMLELLQPKPGDKVLEVGAGSGWVTALLSYIVSASGAPGLPDRQAGRVIAIERLPALKDMAVENVSKYNFVNRGIAEVALGDGSKGYPREAPFDKVTAAATAGSIPVAWKAQLKPGGRIVAPVMNTIEVWDKVGTNDFRCKEYKGFRFVPLIPYEGGNGASG
jgi:protein-L-isoaspartate(D-aspartate) O-methyltransferase